MNTELAKAVIHYIPETVSPASDPNWTFSRHHEAVPGAIKVTETEKGSGFTYTDEYWSNGVRPKGLQVFVEILSKAFQELAIPVDSAVALLE